MSDFSRETKALQLLHSTVKNYERDAFAFYSANDQATSKFTGRFDFKTFAQKMFDPIETSVLGNLYVEMLENSNQYMHMHQKSRTGVPGYSHSFVSIPELLLNMILAYQLPQQKFVPAEKKPEEPITETAEESSATSSTSSSKKKKKSKKGKNVTIHPRVHLTNEMATKLLEEMLKIPLAAESKIWKQVKYVLCPSNCEKQLAVFGEIIAKNTKSGFISFNALNFFMHDQFLNRYLEEPITILHALYIGPLNAQTVEVFAANRTDGFRQKCREVLRAAVTATRDPMSFKYSEPDYIARNHPDRVKYRDFVDTVTQLLRDLNGQYNGSVGIHTGWACAAIKKFGNKRYVDKTWKDENFYDLVWTVLAQRPHLKKFVVEVLEKNFKDFTAARYWRRMQPYQMSTILINNNNVSQEDPLDCPEEFLGFPKGALEGPIVMISNDRDIRNLQNLLEHKMQMESVVHVGVDAEWSAYTSPSKATILQMALKNRVFILDLETTNISTQAYHAFLSFFFDTPQIMKIGFQFGEDLHQLRAAFRNCTSLYQPNNVVCVGKLIMDMMEALAKSDNADEIKRTLLPRLLDDGSAKESADSSIDEGSVADKSMSADSVVEEGAEKPVKDPEAEAKQFLNKGLSYICEKILEKPLDKTEQCSVWNRRPLRNLQLRYAAMDAYCMLMLYDKVGEVFSNLGLDADEFLKQQTPIRISLPLLSEAPL